MQELAESLASRSDKVIQVDKSAILQKLDVYSFLSLQTHAKGLDIYNLQDGRDNVPRYLPKAFDLWYEKVLETFDALCFLYRVFFPKEIASYFKKSKMEMERAYELAKSLSGVMPDFGNLMTDVFAFAGATPPDNNH